jgi:hypothetical protein
MALSELRNHLLYRFGGKKGLTIMENQLNLFSTNTTVSPLTVVRTKVKPGVPPNAGLFLYRVA